MTATITFAPSKCTTVIDLLRARAQLHPERLSYMFLENGVQESTSYTFGELDRRARSLGAFFQSIDGVGHRALMLYPPSVETTAALLGCLYGGVIAAPLVPPDPARANRTMPRLEAVVKDAQARFVLTTSSLLSRLEESVAQFPLLKQMEWIATDKISSDFADEWREPDIEGASLAYLQYTSGSTSSPKGAMVSHANVINICQYDSYILAFQPDGKSVCWMPYFHDFGLIEGLLVPLYNGIPCYVMGPLAFAQQPIRWLSAITRYGATNSSGPNFAFELCVRKTTPEQREGLDLSTWRSAGNAAEPIHKKTMERFIETFEPYGFRRSAMYPCWGLAEATLLVTGRKGPAYYPVKSEALEKGEVMEATEDDEGAKYVVGCGYVVTDMFNTKVAIVEPETRTLCPPGKIGEIWVAGELLSQGYYNRPEETARTFQAYLADTGEGPFLRTGDLGFFRDGDLIIAGRLKDLIIIGGRNHYPQDIELTVEASHPAVHQGCVAAFSIESDEEEKLVVVAEIIRPDSNTNTLHRPEDDVKTITRAIRRAVAECHDIHAYKVVLIKPGTIRKTSSGKIQRHACRIDFQNGALELWTGHTCPAAA